MACSSEMVRLQRHSWWSGCSSAALATLATSRAVRSKLSHLAHLLPLSRWFGVLRLPPALPWTSGSQEQLRQKLTVRVNFLVKLALTTKRLQAAELPLRVEAARACRETRNDGERTCQCRCMRFRILAHP